MTEDEFVEWCDEDIRAEYVDGKVIIMTPESVRMEVVSSDSQERTEDDKYKEYEAFGIREYWIITPLAKRIDAYRLSDQRKYEPLPPDASGVYHSAVIPGFFVNPQWIWCQFPPKKRDILRELGIS